jgi:hypothetical protein
MPRHHLLESKNFVSGGNVQISLKDAPPMQRIRAVLIRFEGVFTQGGAAAAISGSQLCRLFSNVELGKRIKGTGSFFDTLNWFMRGAQLSLPATIPATNAGVFRRTLDLVIPFYDGNAAGPSDALPITSFFRDTPLIVDFANVAALWPALSTVTGTVRAILILDDAEEGVAPSIAQMGYYDLAGQTLILEPGLYTHLFEWNEDLSVITNADVSSVSVSADGQRISDLLRAEELVVIDDYFFARGTALRGDSATVPVPGEQLADEPGVAAGAAATVSMEFLPLVVPPATYKMSQALEVRQALRIDVQGTKVNHRLGYRRIEARSEQQAVKAMIKTGVPNPDPSRIKAKTVSKNELSPRKAGLLRYLPLRHE